MIKNENTSQPTIIYNTRGSWILQDIFLLSPDFSDKLLGIQCGFVSFVLVNDNRQVFSFSTRRPYYFSHKASAFLWTSSAETTFPAAISFSPSLIISICQSCSSSETATSYLTFIFLKKDFISTNWLWFVG